MELRPPDPIIEPSDRKLRFRVEGDGDLHSATWMLVAHRNSDDVYFGIRSQMQVFKVSFHRDTWRMALVKESPQAQSLPAGSDRVMFRWSPSKPVVDHWRRAATVIVPTTSLCRLNDRGRSARVAIFPAPKLGWAMRFDLLLGRPDLNGLTVEAAVGEVGRITLASGLSAWIVASEIRIPGETERSWQGTREQALVASEGMPEPRGWGVIDDADTGCPVFVDLGDVHRPAYQYEWLKVDGTGTSYVVSPGDPILSQFDIPAEQ